MATFTNSLWTEMSVEESFDKTGVGTVTRVFKGPWSERAAFISTAKGGVVARGELLFRQLPARDPDYPWLWCLDAKVGRLDSEVAGDATSSANPLRVRATHSECFVTLTYTQPDNDQVSDAGGDQQEQPSNEQQEMDLATLGWDFSARNFTLPNKYFTWSRDNAGAEDVDNNLLNPQQNGAVITYPGLQLVVTRHMCFRKPTNAILGCLGKVNASVMTLAGDRYPRETLRFDSAKATRKITTNGAKYYEITYSFAVQPIYDKLIVGGVQAVGWNRLYNPATGRWHRVYLKGDNTRYMYELDTVCPTQTSAPGIEGFKLLFHPRAN